VVLGRPGRHALGARHRLGLAERSHGAQGLRPRAWRAYLRAPRAADGMYQILYQIRPDAPTCRSVTVCRR
jgi:hypothetical protein